ncbi:hypothetical protein DFQ50_101476 [Pseudocitrobacter faecalis]|uniref:Uncharacterized protein n=1 Tax=Pseudocitrobacter faecalis TaxID=1398493 RepID=A0ABX9G3B7_9ENTR|nr:hypothetical protein DFQ50_101476 [Pseudocitrobacter faecalis]
MPELRGFICDGSGHPHPNPLPEGEGTDRTYV